MSLLLEFHAQPMRLTTRWRDFQARGVTPDRCRCRVSCDTA